MHKIVFLDRSTIAPQIRLRRPRFDHELIEYQHTRPEEVVDRLSGATIAIVNKVSLTADPLRQLPDLRLQFASLNPDTKIADAQCEHLLVLERDPGGLRPSLHDSIVAKEGLLTHLMSTTKAFARLSKSTYRPNMKHRPCDAIEPVISEGGLTLWRNENVQWHRSACSYFYSLPRLSFSPANRPKRIESVTPTSHPT